MTGAEDLTVFVCALDERIHLEACLTALILAGVSAPWIVSGSSQSSQLRNLALAECSTELIAFIDDDIEVDKDWLKAIITAWQSADESVACVAGEIKPRFIGERPDWLSYNLLSAFGAESPELAGGVVGAATATFHAGNLTFRAAAARGAGGFWPVRGAGRTRDMLSEEHHLQHQLSNAGWKAIYEPAARATRLIDATDTGVLGILTMYATSSARAEIVDGPASPSVSITAPIRSGAGALAAAATGRRKLAVQRATRAAKRAAARAPTMIAGHTLDPASSSTPFLHSIAAARRSDRSKRTTTSNRIICLHAVADEALPSGMSTTTDAFRSQLDALLAQGPPATLDAIAAGTAPKNAFAISFDDGYASNLHLALPILESAGVPATFFISTGHVLSGRRFWWDEVARLLKHAGSDGVKRPVLDLECAGERRSWAPSDAAHLMICERQIVAWFQPSPPEEIELTLGQLREWAGPGAPAPDPAERPLTVDELLQLAASPLATIGAHTRQHPCLLTSSPERRKEELSGSRDDIEKWTGVAPTSIAYPFGIWGSDVNEAVADAARECGYAVGVVNGPGPSGHNPLALGRSSLVQP